MAGRRYGSAPPPAPTVQPNSLIIIIELSRSEPTLEREARIKLLVGDGIDNQDVEARGLNVAGQCTSGGDRSIAGQVEGPE